MKTVAIIPAGGSGKRMRESLAKQYILLDGIPILARTLMVFQASHAVDDIFLVVPQNDVAFARDSIVEKFGLSKVIHVLPGGIKRQDSVKNGIDLVGTEYDVVVIHDGVRPFITAELVSISVSEAAQEKAVAVGVPAKDTVKIVNDRGWVAETLDRDYVWLTQTPQAFQRDIIKTAYEAAYENRYYGTDDASLVERLGVRVKMVHGSYDNIKITTKNDLVLADALIKRANAISG